MQKGPFIRTTTLRAMRVSVVCALAAAAAFSAAGGPTEARHAAIEETAHLRPLFHFTPPRHFMNDPNGLVFHDGQYHLFYQHNPEGDRWGHMSWGHAVSGDLLHWEHRPIALREEGGIMVFSGSAVADPANTSGLCGDAGASCLVAIYTGRGHGKQTQNLAVSPDSGRTWTKYAGNPVLDLSRNDHRDPKVFWHEPTTRWIMVSVLAGEQKVRFFASRDLREWEALSDFGPAGATGGAWECPDLFPLPVDGDPTDVRWVLNVDLYPGGRLGGSGSQYFVGAFDGHRFVNENPDDLTLWVDYGRDFYASQSYAGLPASDGRHVWIGWMSNWIYAEAEPTAPWRGVQSLPRELALRRTLGGVRLVQFPVRELSSVAGPAREVRQPAPLGDAAVVRLEVVPGDWTEAGFRVANAHGEEVVVGVDTQPLEVFVDRRRSRETPFHDAYPERHAAPVRWIDGRVTLEVVWDRSTLEVFANGGEAVISDRVFPLRPLDRVEPLHGGARLARPLSLGDLTARAGGDGLPEGERP